MDALKKLEERLPAEELMKIWTDCIATVYREQAVWVHGDVAPGNILLQNGRFYGLIDSREQRAKRTCLHVHLATAARVKYPAALLRCKFDAP